MDGISVRTLRARIWRGIVDGNASATTLAEHVAILSALSARDPALAFATALVHVNTTEQWLREHLADLEGHDDAGLLSAEPAAVDRQDGAVDVV
jgi:GntR family transcriptional repressor for pyruvate dehydrogenase complex